MTTKKPNSLNKKSISKLRPEVDLDLMTDHPRTPEDEAHSWADSYAPDQNS